MHLVLDEISVVKLVEDRGCGNYRFRKEIDKIAAYIQNQLTKHCENNFSDGTITIGAEGEIPFKLNDLFRRMAKTASLWYEEKHGELSDVIEASTPISDYILEFFNKWTK